MSWFEASPYRCPCCWMVGKDSASVTHGTFCVFNPSVEENKYRHYLQRAEAAVDASWEKNR